MTSNHRQRFPPTHAQLTALWHIHEHARTHRYPISIRELCERLGVSSTNGTSEKVTALVRKGLAEKDAMVARSVRVTPLGARFLLGFVPAGQGGRSRWEPTDNAARQVKSDSQSVNNGEGA